MFKFLKDKLKGAISKFSEKVDEEASEETKEEEITEEEVEEKEEQTDEELKKIEEEAEKEKKELERIEEEKKQKLAEEKKKQEEEQKKLEEENKRLEEEKKAAEEEEKKKQIEEEQRKKEEELRKAEEQRKKEEAEERARLESERKQKEEDLKKLEEEKKQKEEELKDVKEKKGLFAKLKDKFVGEEKPAEKPVEPETPSAEKPEEEKPSEPEKTEPAEPEKPASGFMGKLKQTIVTKKIAEKQFDEMFWDLEVSLLENNVAVEVIEKIKKDMKEALVDKPIDRNKINDIVIQSLKKSLEDLFDIDKVDLLAKASEKKPFVVCFIGINGSGKTTSIAKVANYLKENGLTVILAAADTFRAAAIDQLQQHADNLKLKLIKHDYGADAAAVAFDAVEHAKAKGADIVLIDTAGRMHSNTNLMDEVKKLIKVAKPDMNIFVGESITGNDCVEQAKKFDDAVGIDGIVLSKADVDEKGGAAISISHVTGKPILFIGTGQEYKDLKEFDSGLVLESLGL